MERSAVPLAATLATDFVPESNVCGRLAYADDRYLHPDLGAGRTLHLGLPGGITPARFVEQLVPGKGNVFLTRDDEVADSVRRARRRSDLPPVEVVVVAGWDRIPISPASAHLVLVGTGPGGPRPSAFSALAPELARVVGADGTVALEAGTFRDARRARRLGKRLADVGLKTDRTLWLLRLAGSVRMAAEEGDLPSARRLLSWLGRGASVRRRIFRIGVGLLDSVGLLGAFLSRRRLFFFGTEDAGRSRPGRPPEDGRSREDRGSASAPSLWPPPYLRSVLLEADIDPARFRCGFQVHGRYDSNKVAFFLFDRETGEPRHIVKATRAPRFNHRLENEHRSMSLLETEGYLPRGAFPERTILTYRGGLAVLGLRFVPGRPLRAATRAEADCPLVERVIQHLETLAVSSARRDPGSAGVIGEGLERLHHRFADLFPTPAREADFLRRQVEILQEGAAHLPLVFQHGDAGIWNVMADGEEAVLLDWEAGEPAGMPLWDLFYFLRSVGSWRSALGGERDLVRSYEKHFLTASPLARLQARSVDRYRRRLDLSEELVEPLRYTCWMHRALRQAMQLAPEELEGCVYYRLLLSAIRARGRGPGKGLREKGAHEQGEGVREAGIP